MILVTGGAGFIGSHFVAGWLRAPEARVVNLDKLTYAGNLDNLAALQADARHVFVRGDIGDARLLQELLLQHRPRALVNFAAESHVDRSIHGAAEFIQTNVVGTFALLESATKYWQSLAGEDRDRFRFLHVSTDEVYGSLAPGEPAFAETRRFEPNSPYSASKAASDHLVRAWHHTHGLPVLTTNCSNNYGPMQFPEKLIPLMIHSAISGKPLPIYGDGGNIRDWLYVTDHCRAIELVLASGRIGEIYNVGGGAELTNLEVVEAICDALDARRPAAHGRSYRAQMTFVKDRPGHDRRYAIDAGKIHRELGWSPVESFPSGLAKTVDWYLGHADWVDRVTTGAYRAWMDTQYGGSRS